MAARTRFWVFPPPPTIVIDGVRKKQTTQGDHDEIVSRVEPEEEDHSSASFPRIEVYRWVRVGAMLVNAVISVGDQRRIIVEVWPPDSMTHPTTARAGDLDSTSTIGTHGPSDFALRFRIAYLESLGYECIVLRPRDGEHPPHTVW